MRYRRPAVAAFAAISSGVRPFGWLAIYQWFQPAASQRVFARQFVSL